MEPGRWGLKMRPPTNWRQGRLISVTELGRNMYHERCPEVPLGPGGAGDEELSVLWTFEGEAGDSKHDGVGGLRVRPQRRWDPRGAHFSMFRPPG
jgi:hypothetical protein